MIVILLQGLMENNVLGENFSGVVKFEGYGL